MKRRDALKTIGGLAGMAGLSRFLPGCHGSSGDSQPVGITTYVYMMMENRSYDHFFGSRKLDGKAGDGIVAGTTLLDINNQPVPLWVPDLNQECDRDPPHGWDALHQSFNNGLNDQFLKVHQMEYADANAIEPMQYLTSTQVPVSYALADNYTSCDRWFCSVMGPTWPNRFYWHAGTSFGLMANTLPTQLSPSIYHRLNAKGIDWKYYYGNIPVVSVIMDIDVTPNVARFADFLTDAAAGTLPPVVYIDPGFNDNDDHPPVHPINGQELISAVYTALANSPQWNNVMLVITYDENGGFYDHVPPPKTQDDLAAQGFDQLGFRVPTMVIGPYAKQNYVSSVQYDHTSALRHLENVFELDELSLRTSVANDLTDCIDLDRLAAGDPAPPIEIPAVDITQWPMSQECFGGSFKQSHPILDWADANPHRVAGLDLRGERDEYRRTIREYLAANRVATAAKVR